jgi:hypothetical protein
MEPATKGMTGSYGLAEAAVIRYAEEGEEGEEGEARSRVIAAPARQITPPRQDSGPGSWFSNSQDNRTTMAGIV